MPTPKLKPGHPSWELAVSAYQRVQNGERVSDVAEDFNKNWKTIENWILKVKQYEALDPAIGAAQEAVGTDITPRLVWAKTKNEDGTSYSVLLRPETPEAEDFKSVLDEIITDAVRNAAPKLPPKFTAKEGHMLVLDPADVHVGKLCVKTETGYEYNVDIAEHRLVEGCKSLMERAKLNGATRVALVIGNDISHVDNAQKASTAGTPQDVSGSVFDIFRVAERAYVRTVEAALKLRMSVVVIFNPSNHDWVLGFAIARTIAAWFREHPNVDASDYCVSERHRKYLRFGRNLIMLSHGDGAQEAKLPQIMMREARPHIGDCDHLYVYLHHYHHKKRKALGLRDQDRELDHIAMTVMHSGVGAMEGDNINIEYVRSPSPPDGWHDRNGYLNRQAVEAYLHCMNDGQIMRFTEWF